MDQLQKVWKKKALFYIGKSQLKKQNYDEAIAKLEEALALASDSEIKTLIADAKTRRSKEKQKEKATWSKAFKRGKSEEGSIYHDPKDEEVVASPSAKSAPVTPAKPASTAPIDPNNLKFDLSDLGLKKKGSSGSTKTTAASSSTTVQPWQPDLFTQYGIWFGLGVLVAGFGASYWFLQHRKR